MGLALFSVPAFAGSSSISSNSSTFLTSRYSGNNAAGNNGGCGFVIAGTDGGLRANDGTTTNPITGTYYGLYQFTMPALKLKGRVTISGSTFTIGANGLMPSNNGVTLGSFNLWKINNAWSSGIGCGAAVSPTRLAGSACSSSAVWATFNCVNGWSAWTLRTTLNPVASSASSLQFTGANLDADVLDWITNGNSNGWAITPSGAGIQSFAKTASLSFTWTCGGAFLDTASGCSTCTSNATTDCNTGAGNSCVDNFPTNSYSCSCGANYHNYTAADSNPGCFVNCTTTNTCRQGTDSTATCADSASSPGYTCGCTTANGYIFNGTTCVKSCVTGTSNPCGVGSNSCTALTGTTWTCSCKSGWFSSGAPTPVCADFNACTGPPATGDIACVTSRASNHCSDDAAPSLGWSCSCLDPAYEGNTTPIATSCIDKDECKTNHCIDGGDTKAFCGDHVAPQIGYDCTCTAPFWVKGKVAGLDSCIDVDECKATVNPCVHGVCTNTKGSYTCACDPPYVSSGGPAPVCVPPGCDDKAVKACVTSQTGNVCVPKDPPAVGYTCNCGAAGFVTAPNRQSCQTGGQCTPNHCVDDGDRGASCSSAPSTRAGYACTCDPGWKFDGASCADIDECTLGGNPCGVGTCSNNQGGYDCICPAGYSSTGGTAPTCASYTGNSDTVTYKVTAGTGCSMSGEREPTGFATLLLLAGFGVAWKRRRAKRLT